MHVHACALAELCLGERLDSITFVNKDLNKLWALVLGKAQQSKARRS